MTNIEPTLQCTFLVSPPCPASPAGVNAALAHPAMHSTFFFYYLFLLFKRAGIHLFQRSRPNKLLLVVMRIFNFISRAQHRPVQGRTDLTFGNIICWQPNNDFECLFGNTNKNNFQYVFFNQKITTFALLIMVNFLRQSYYNSCRLLFVLWYLLVWIRWSVFWCSSKEINWFHVLKKICKDYRKY